MTDNPWVEAEEMLDATFRQEWRELSDDLKSAIVGDFTDIVTRNMQAGKTGDVVAATMGAYVRTHWMNLHKHARRVVDAKMDALAQTVLATEFLDEWTELPELIKPLIIADFRLVVADPGQYGYDETWSISQLADHYHRNIGTDNLASYGSVVHAREPEEGDEAPIQADDVVTLNSPLHGTVVEVTHTARTADNRSGRNALIFWDDDSFSTHPVDALAKIYGKGEAVRERKAREIFLSRADYLVGNIDAERYQDEEYGALRRVAVRQYRTYAHVLADGILPECGHSVVNATCVSGDHWICGSHEHPYTGDQVHLPFTSTLIFLEQE